MKKILVASLLGMALNITTSHGQGYIIMENYRLVNGVTPVFSGVRYYPGGPYVGAGFKADLLYSLNGGVTFTLAAGSQANFFQGSQDGGTPTTDGAGTFFGPTVTIPGYTSGSVQFIVRAFNGASYGAASFYNGQSAPFTINSLQSNPLIPPDDLLQLNGGTTATGLQPFVLVPEPSIFGLAGLGAAGLMAFRRRK